MPPVLPSHIYLPYTNHLKYGFIGSVTEDYFYWGGSIAELEEDQSVPETVLLKMTIPIAARSWGQMVLDGIKILSYATGIIPLIMYIANKIFRSSNHFGGLKRTKNLILASINQRLTLYTEEEFEKYNQWGAKHLSAVSFLVEDRIWVLETHNTEEKQTHTLKFLGKIMSPDGDLVTESQGVNWSCLPGEPELLYQITKDEAEAIRALLTIENLRP